MGLLVLAKMTRKADFAIYRYLLQPQILGQEAPSQEQSHTTHTQMEQVSIYRSSINFSLALYPCIELDDILRPSYITTVKGGKFIVDIWNGQPRIYHPTTLKEYTGIILFRHGTDTM